MDHKQFLSCTEFSNYIDDVIVKRYEPDGSNKYSLAMIYGIISNQNKNNKHYLKIIKDKTNEFNMFAEHEPELFLDMLAILTNQSEHGYLYIFETTHFPVWNIMFLADYDNYLGRVFKPFLRFIRMYSHKVDTIYNLNNFIKDNQSAVLYRIDKFQVRIMDRIYIEHPDFIYVNVDVLHKIAQLSYNIDVWEKIICLCTYTMNISKFEHIYLEHKWVFANMDVENMLDIISDKLNKRIVNKVSEEETFHEFCNNLIYLIHLVFNIANINNKCKSLLDIFLRNNINKIIVLHNNVQLLEKIKGFNIDIFKHEDASGFHPFTDIIRYGDYKCVKWFTDNIFNDYETTLDSLNNCFVTNNGMVFIFENPDQRILADVLLLFEKYPSLLNLTLILYVPQSSRNFNFKNIRAFSKKVKLFIDFIKRTNNYYLFDRTNFIKDSLINLEAQIDNNNFTPFILNTLCDINAHHPGCISILDISTIDIHNKYKNIADIRKLIDLSLLNTDSQCLKKRKEIMCSFIKQNIMFSKFPPYTSCFCKFHSLVIDMMNYTFNKTYSRTSLPDLTHALHFIDFTMTPNYYERNIFWNMVSALDASISHKCFKNKHKLYDNIITLFDSITPTPTLKIPYKQLGPLPYIMCSDYHIEFIKRLSMHNYHFDYIQIIYKRSDITWSINKKQDYHQYNYGTDNCLHYKKIIKKDTRAYYLFKTLKTLVKNTLDILLEMNKEAIKTKKIDWNRHVSLKVQNGVDKYIINESYSRLQGASSHNLSYDNATIIPQFKHYKKLRNLVDTQGYTNINKYLAYIKKSIALLKAFYNTLTIHINQYKNNIYCKTYLLAVFSIKLYVKNRVETQFLLHKSTIVNVLKELTSRNKCIKSTNKLNTSEQLLQLLNASNRILCEPTIDVMPSVITAPSLLSITDLLERSDTHRVITQKIDGCTKRGIRLVNSFPRCNVNNLFDVEFDKETKMNFIIGITKSSMYGEKTFINFIHKLRECHDYTKPVTFPDKISVRNVGDNTLNDSLKQELKNYNKYLADSKLRVNRGQLLWWPKMFYTLEYNNFEEYIYLINYFKTHPHLQIFKNDGWILQHKDYLCNTDLIIDHLISFKIKETALVTIDLQVVDNKWYFNNGTLRDFEEIYNYNVIPKTSLSNNTIYRCYPILTNDSVSNDIIAFEARDRRDDKKLPNNVNIVNESVKLILNPINLNALLNMIHNAPSYYTKLPINIRSSGFSSTCSAILGSFIKGDVIDLGGGFKTGSYLNKFNDTISKCVSTDSDINVIVKNTRSILDNPNKSEFELSFNSKLCYKFLDFTKNYNDYSALESQLSLGYHNTDTFDTITMFNSINFALKNKTTSDAFLKTISNLAKNNTHIVIKWMDLEAFMDGYNKVNLDDTNIILRSICDSSFINMNLNKGSNRIYYEWAHDKPIDETIISRTTLINLFRENNWHCLHYRHHDKYNDSLLNIKNMDSLWDHYFYSFSDIVFKYKD